jgi:hypothetical protein
MSTVRYILISILFCLFISCSDDDDDLPGGNPGDGQTILDAIVGDWDATSASFVTTNSNPVLSRDVVADGGFCSLVVAQNGNFTLVIGNPGFPDPQITTGQFLADGSVINVYFDSDPNTSVSWDFTLSGNNLNIVGPLAYDFENNGIFVETSANMQFIPN